MIQRSQFIINVVTAIAAIGVVRPAVAQVTQINQVQVNTVNDTLKVRLATTDGDMTQFFTSRFGETVVIDLINTQLNLETGDSVVRDNPAPGIASVQVAPLDGNSIRITINGVEQAPTVEVGQADGELIVGVATADAVVEQPPTNPPSEEPEPSEPTTEEMPEPETPTAPTGIEDDALRLVVTGEADADVPYLAPETTFGTRTESSIFEIPQTIQVLPDQLLEDQQITRLEEAILNVPNAVSSNAGGGAAEEFVIRGFRSATIFRDGFRGTTDRGAQQAPTELANVERIEVLSGPASILVGNAEPGG